MIWNIKKSTKVTIELEREELEKLMHGEDISDWINIDLEDIVGHVDINIYCSNPAKILMGKTQNES